MSDPSPTGWYCSVTQLGDVPSSWVWGPFATQEQAQRKMAEAAQLGTDGQVYYVDGSAG